MIRDPAEILRSLFPAELLNFDTPPAGMTVGPLHAIFTQVGQVLANFQADELLAQAQLTVQQASGPYLDAHGVFYGLLRLVGEDDDPFRERILLAMRKGKLTIAAITFAVQLYYATARYPHIVTVYDLQSNPPLALAVLPPFFPLQKEDFVINIVTEIPATLVFFAGRSFATGIQLAQHNTYVVSPDPTYTDTPTDAMLAAEVTRTKSGGTHPIYGTSRVPI